MFLDDVNVVARRVEVYFSRAFDDIGMRRGKFAACLRIEEHVIERDPQPMRGIKPIERDLACA
jgi:hypothetical protein